MDAGWIAAQRANTNAKTQNGTPQPVRKTLPPARPSLAAQRRLALMRAGAGSGAGGALPGGAACRG